jgi:hypothetical protein
MICVPTIIRAPGARNVDGGGKDASYLIQNAGDAGFPANLNIIRCAADHGVGAPGHVSGDTTGQMARAALDAAGKGKGPHHTRH